MVRVVWGEGVGFRVTVEVVGWRVGRDWRVVADVCDGG